MHLELSKSNKNFLIPTLNNTGYTPAKPDIIQKAFIRFAKHAKNPLLDVGAAFGITSLLALNNGGYIIANDLDARHLEAIKQNAPLSLVNKLELVVGRMPQDLDFKEESLSGILVARVLHFLTGQEIMESLHKIFKWLTPKGKVFFVATTPFIKILEPFIPVYNDRKQSGELWPGTLEDVKKYQSMNVEAMPSFVHLLDEDIVRRIFTEAGFKIKKLNYFAAECPQEWLYDGREFIGCIAEKS